MGLSKRERMIVLMTIVVVGALVGDKFVVAPLLNRLRELQSQRQQSLDKVAKAKNLFAQKQQYERRNKTLLIEDLRSDAEAESSVARALDKWSEDARLTLTSVKPDRVASDKGLKEIIFVVAGKGSLDAVAWFLYQVEISELPIKVKYMQLGSTSESGDSMSLELRLSALYVASAGEKPSPKQSQPKQREKNNEDQLL
jgi:Tfp pilus assembly protein PilO